LKDVLYISVSMQHCPVYSTIVDRAGKMREREKGERMSDVSKRTCLSTDDDPLHFFQLPMIPYHWIMWRF